jgi:hypothetical protein
VPSREGLRPDKEMSSASSRQSPAKPSKHGGVHRQECRTRYLSAQDSDLVAEDDDLDGQVRLAAP